MLEWKQNKMKMIKKSAKKNKSRMKASWKNKMEKSWAKIKSSESQLKMDTTVTYKKKMIDIFQ